MKGEDLCLIVNLLMIHALIHMGYFTNDFHTDFQPKKTRTFCLHRLSLLVILVITLFSRLHYFYTKLP